MELMLILKTKMDSQPLQLQKIQASFPLQAYSRGLAQFKIDKVEIIKATAF